VLQRGLDDWPRVGPCSRRAQARVLSPGRCSTWNVDVNNLTFPGGGNSLLAGKHDWPRELLREESELQASRAFAPRPPSCVSSNRRQPAPLGENHKLRRCREAMLMNGESPPGSPLPETARRQQREGPADTGPREPRSMPRNESLS